VTKPCDRCPEIPCAHAGFCWGKIYWEGKTEKAKPLAQVQECKWVDRCRKWWLDERRNQQVAPDIS
jgi:hypothetical protein